MNVKLLISIILILNFIKNITMLNQKNISTSDGKKKISIGINLRNSSRKKIFNEEDNNFQFHSDVVVINKIPYIAKDLTTKNFVLYEKLFFNNDENEEKYVYIHFFDSQSKYDESEILWESFKWFGLDRFYIPRYYVNHNKQFSVIQHTNVKPIDKMILKKNFDELNQFVTRMAIIFYTFCNQNFCLTNVTIDDIVYYKGTYNLLKQDDIYFWLHENDLSSSINAKTITFLDENDDKNITENIDEYYLKQLVLLIMSILSVDNDKLYDLHESYLYEYNNILSNNFFTSTLDPFKDIIKDMIYKSQIINKSNVYEMYDLLFSNAITLSELRNKIDSPFVENTPF